MTELPPLERVKALLNEHGIEHVFEESQITLHLDEPNTRRLGRMADLVAPHEAGKITEEEMARNIWQLTARRRERILASFAKEHLGRVIARMGLETRIAFSHTVRDRLLALFIRETRK